jgi:hypothetical protein
MKTLKPRTIEFLRTVHWSEEYRWPIEPVLEKLREFGHELHPAAQQFLSRYGGLTFHRMNRYQPQSTVMCHTNAIEAASEMSPQWLDAGAELAESKLCPIGGCGHGDYLMAMDESGQVWGMNHYLEWREYATSGEELLDALAGMPPVT